MNPDLKVKAEGRDVPWVLVEEDRLMLPGGIQ
jgi:hypothetical protein